MATALKNRFGVEARLIKSGGGVFEVVKDDVLIFSKKQTGRFPEHDEIFKKIGER